MKLSELKPYAACGGKIAPLWTMAPESECVMVMGDAGGVMSSFTEQMKVHDDAQKQRKFTEAVISYTGVPIAMDDLHTVIEWSRDQLFIVALLAVAKARIERDKPAEPPRDGSR